MAPPSARSQLDPALHRGGLLGQGAVLTVTSYNNRTSVVLRGKWILENILAAAPPPPPPQRADAERRQERQGHDRPPADGSAPRQSGLRLLPHQDGPAGLQPGELRRGGQMAHRLCRLGWWTLRPCCRTAPSSKAPSGLQDILLSRKDQFVEALTERLMTYALARGRGILRHAGGARCSLPGGQRRLPHADALFWALFKACLSR